MPQLVRQAPDAKMMTCPNCGGRENEKRFMFYEPFEMEPDFYCLTCRQKFEQEELERRRKEQKQNQLISEVAKLGKASNIDLTTISDLWMEVVDQFGGIDQFAAFWKQQLMRAASTEKGAGSSRVLSACASLARICAMSSQHEVSKMPVARMTDKQLSDELVTFLKRLPVDDRARLLDLSEAEDVEFEVN